MEFLGEYGSDLFPEADNLDLDDDGAERMASKAGGVRQLVELLGVAVQKVIALP